VKAPLFSTLWSKDLKRFFVVLRVFWSSYEFLHGIHAEKLMNVVVVSEEIRGDFPRPFELTVFSDHRLYLLNKRVFGVIARDVEGSVVGVLKLLGLCELDDPGRNRNRAVRSRLIEANFQENSILEASD